MSYILSCHDTEECIVPATSKPSWLLDTIRREVDIDPTFVNAHDQITIGDLSPNTMMAHPAQHQGLRGGIPHTLPQMLQLAHTASHKGEQKMVHRLRADFHIKHDHTLVHVFVHACAMCQRNKRRPSTHSG